MQKKLILNTMYRFKSNNFKFLKKYNITSMLCYTKDLNEITKKYKKISFKL